jgi:DNA-directed RNA polymerase subunit alpha
MYRNFCKKSLNEIKEKLAGLGLTLGMTFPPELLEPLKEEAPKPAPVR